MPLLNKTETKLMWAKPEEASDKIVMAAAYAILARSAHSRAQVREKLQRKGFAAELIEGCLDRLEELGYLDDGQVARRWAQVMLHERHWGVFKAEQRLQKRGINRDLARQVLDEAQRDFSQTDGARQALAGRFADRADVPLAKVVSFLRSRGFSGEVVYTAAREWEQQHGAGAKAKQSELDACNYLTEQECTDDENS
jgi:regulatory protein